MDASRLPALAFAKTFSFSLKQIRLYSENHPITKETLRKLDLELGELFVSKERLSIGAIRHRLLLDGSVVPDKEVAAHELAKDLERLGIEGLVIDKGVTIEEITAFVGLMAMRAKSISDKGGFRKAFEDLNMRHVRLSQGKFQLVEEGETVVDASAVGSSEEGNKSETPSQASLPSASLGTPAALPGGIPLTDLASIVRKIRQQAPGGVVGSEPVILDAEKILGQLEKTPKDLVEAALTDAADEARLEVVIRQMVKVLMEGLLGFLVEQGKDITKALEKLAKELEKGIARLEGDGGEYQRLKEKIPLIFEEASDELRIQMVRKTVEKNPGDVKLLEKIAAKLFKDKEIRDRLGSSLKEELSETGLSPETIETIFAKIEGQAEKKKKKTSIDIEELEELRRKAKLYEAQADGTIDKQIQNLELENKIVSHQKQRMDAVIRNLAEGLLVVDEEGKVVLMNPAAEKLLGVKQSDKAGKDVSEGLSSEHVVSMASGPLRDKPGMFSEQVQLAGQSEETKRIVKASTAVIENEDGQTVGMVSVLTDITRQKELDDLKTKFVANVSHELRTPLVAIQKSLSLILQKEVGDITPDQEKFLSIAHRNIDRLSRLINDLLDVSKLEAGQLNLKPTVFPVSGLVQHVLSTVETWANDKKIKLKTEFSSQNIEIEADADRLTQVLTNLLGNAIKFTPDEGTITIEAKSGVRDEALGEDCVELAVCDTGIGIAPEDQKKIFEKFVQVSLYQPAGVSSTGLGLTITKEIVELHSGRIWVESAEGKGSRFVFRVPSKFRQQKPKTPAF